jgi:hypothetical protein
MHLICPTTRFLLFPDVPQKLLLFSDEAIMAIRFTFRPGSCTQTKIFNNYTLGLHTPEK